MGTRFLWLVGIYEADLCAKFWPPGGSFWYRKSHLKFFTKRGKKGCYQYLILTKICVEGFVGSFDMCGKFWSSSSLPSHSYR